MKKIKTMPKVTKTKMRLSKATDCGYLSTEVDIDELVEQKIIDMIKEDQARMLSYLVIQAGNICHETGAGTLDLSTEATYDEKRYKVVNTTMIKKIN